MELERLEKLEEQLERSLELVREQRRELINRNMMNDALKIVDGIYSSGKTPLEQFGTSWGNLSRININPFTGEKI